MAVSKKIHYFELQLYCYQAARKVLNDYSSADNEDCPFIDGMTVKEVLRWVDRKVDMYSVLLACEMREAQKPDPEN